MRRVVDWADLEERILFLHLEFVGPKELETAQGFFFGETLLCALEELEDVVDNDGFEVDLFLIVEVFRLEFDLSNNV